VTRQLLWEEYRAEQPTGYSYTQFCFHYQEWKSRLKLVMRQTHRAGEKLFVDYCGPTVPVINALTGEVREPRSLWPCWELPTTPMLRPPGRKDCLTGSAHIPELRFLWRRYGPGRP
jgi:hypothetical protein